MSISDQLFRYFRSIVWVFQINCLGISDQLFGYFRSIVWVFQIDKVVKEHLDHADMSAKDISSTWMLVAEDGEMKVYKRELEENGMVIDPLKAVHTVKVITVKPVMRGCSKCVPMWQVALYKSVIGNNDSMNNRSKLI